MRKTLERVNHSTPGSSEEHDLSHLDDDSSTRLTGLEGRLQELQNQRLNVNSRDTGGSHALHLDRMYELEEIDGDILATEVEIASIKNPEFAKAVAEMQRNVKWGKRLARAKGWVRKTNENVNFMHSDFWE